MLAVARSYHGLRGHYLAPSDPPPPLSSPDGRIFRLRASCAAFVDHTAAGITRTTPLTQLHTNAEQCMPFSSGCRCRPNANKRLAPVCHPGDMCESWMSLGRGKRKRRRLSLKGCDQDQAASATSRQTMERAWRTHGPSSQNRGERSLSGRRLRPLRPNPRNRNVVYHVRNKCEKERRGRT